VTLHFLVWNFTWSLWLFTLVIALVGRWCGSDWAWYAARAEDRRG